MIEVLKQAFTDAKRNERHNNVAETRYWLNQYKLIAEQAIAELESQEPFCYVYKENGEDFFAPKDGYYPADAKPLYTHRLQRTWVGLTDEETSGFTQHEMFVVKYVSKVLQEKNT
jgi:hypothetical protein